MVLGGATVLTMLATTPLVICEKTSSRWRALFLHGLSLTVDQGLVIVGPVLVDGW